MNRQQEYRDYLRSPAWKSLSLLARMRAGNFCEFCGAHGDHVHHVKYPKRFSEDHVDNLIVVCEYHHSMMHGIRGEIMSGDITIIEGVEIVADENNKQWFDFSSLFTKLWTDENGNMVVGEVALRESMNGAFGKIRDKYRKIEKVNFDGGSYKLRYLVSKEGAQQFASSYSHPKMHPFQDWLFEKVLPQIEKTGSYSIKSTGNYLADLAYQISALGSTTAKAILDAERAEKTAKQAEIAAAIAQSEALKAKQEAMEANKKADGLVERMDEITGNHFYLTSRHALLKMGLNPESIFCGKQTLKMKLGAVAAQYHRDNGIPLPPKVFEGSYEVNQYSLEALRESVKILGLVSKKKTEKT